MEVARRCGLYRKGTELDLTHFRVISWQELHSILAAEVFPSRALHGGPWHRSCSLSVRQMIGLPLCPVVFWLETVMRVLKSIFTLGLIMDLTHQTYRNAFSAE
jgi:hypothetical protein